MSASADLQAAIEQRLREPGVLRIPVEIVQRRAREQANDIEAAAAAHGLCLYVMPPLPTRALQGVDAVFFEAAEVRVRIVEQPAMNSTGVDAYDLVDDLCAGLHWQLLGGEILSEPLQLAARPTEMVEDPRTRIIDVLFQATYGLAPQT